MDLEKKVEELGQAIETFKKSNDEALKQIKEKGAADTVLNSQIEKANEAITALQAEIKAMQTAANRTQSAGASNSNASDLEQKAAFEKYIRKGIESKALSVDSDPDGGYLVRAELAAKVIEKLFETSPIRQVADVISISSDALELYNDSDEAGAEWAGEAATRSTTTTPQLKMIKVPVHEIFAKPKATQKLLDDAAWNMEAWLQKKLSDKFGRTENTAFVSGNGVAKPMGFLSYAAGTSHGQIEQVISGSAATITADGLISLLYSLKAGYQANATFLMQRLTLAAVRKLKDSQNRYLWEPGLNGDGQERILGKKVFMADDMPALAADALSVACGDFKQGYQIVDRIGMRILRDPFSAKPFVEFYTTKRVGGGVVNFEAIKIGKCST
jgi:HK97 family phage major capsid protein